MRHWTSIALLCVGLGCGDPAPAPAPSLPPPVAAPAPVEAAPAESEAPSSPSDPLPATEALPTAPASSDDPPPAPAADPAASLASALGAADETALLAQASANVQGRAYQIVLYEGRGRFFERFATAEALEAELDRLRAGCDEDAPDYDACIARVAGGDRHLHAALGGDVTPGAEFVVAKVRHDRRANTCRVEARLLLVPETQGPPSEGAPEMEIRVRDFDRDGVVEASVTYSWTEPLPGEELAEMDRAQTVIVDLRALAVQAVLPRYFFDDRGNNEGISVGAVYRFTGTSADAPLDLTVRAVAGFGNDCPFEEGFPRMGVPGWCSIERATFSCPYDAATDRFQCDAPVELEALAVLQPQALRSE